MRDKWGNMRDVASLFQRQGSSINHPKVQEKFEKARDKGQAVRDHLLNSFDCKCDIHTNCVSPCRTPETSPGVRKELQLLKKRLAKKLDMY